MTNTVTKPDLMATTDAAIEMIEQGVANVTDVKQSLAFIEQLKAAVKELTARHEAAVIKFIDLNGEIEDGEKRYYVGLDKQHRCKDTRELLSRILEQGGDADLLAKCLSSQPWKPATAKEMLGDAATDLFETITRPSLEEGKPKRRLKAALVKGDPINREWDKAEE